MDDLAARSQANRLGKQGKFRIHTSLDPAQSCDIGNVQIVRIATPKVVTRLWDRWRIIATSIVHEEFEGLRVTPNVDTTIEEIETLASAMEQTASTGIESGPGWIISLDFRRHHRFQACPSSEGCR
jgi:selenocysteine lyase/cysteine desulfurase